MEKWNITFKRGTVKLTAGLSTVMIEDNGPTASKCIKMMLTCISVLSESIFKNKTEIEIFWGKTKQNWSTPTQWLNLLAFSKRDTKGSSFNENDHRCRNAGGNEKQSKGQIND